VDQAGSHFMVWNFAQGPRVLVHVHDKPKLSIFSAALFGHGSSNISADTSWHLEIDLKNFFN